MGQDKYRRVILWSAPRSMSTAIFMCMVNNPQMRCVFEPYCRPYYFGPNNISDLFSKKNHLDEREKYDDVTYRRATEDLENQPLEANEILFAKEMAYTVMQKYGADVLEHLPKDTLHTFLVRNPGKAIPSVYKMIEEFSGKHGVPEWERYSDFHAGYKELYELYNLVKKNEAGSDSGSDIMVLDTDTLLENPEAILKLYCNKVGVPYAQSMIDWEIKPTEKPEFGDDYSQTWFKEIYNSKRLERRKTNTKVSLEGLPEKVQKKVDECMEYYNSMLPFCVKKK